MPKKIGNAIASFFKNIIKKCRTNIPFAVFLSIFLVAFVVFIFLLADDISQYNKMRNANSNLEDIIHNAELSKTPSKAATPTNEGTDPAASPTGGSAGESASPTPENTRKPEETQTPTPTNTPTNTPTPTPSPAMTAGGAAAYEKNNDYVGWLEVLGSYNGGLSEKNRINYPVFQTFDDPSTPYDPSKPETNEGWYYLDRDANGNKNENGSLFVEECCTIGTGTKEDNYANGVKPSSNIIIYGHNVVNYIMFGALKQYWGGFYYSHKNIAFTTCYEYREYEIIAVIDDVVPDDDSYYFASFINAYTQNDFDKWYNYLKTKSVRNTGVTAEFGDEFITLVTCATGESDNRRKVVVAKRIK